MSKARYKFKCDEEVTVDPVKTGTSKNGVVTKRSLAQGQFNTDIPLYTILFDDDSAETLVMERRIHPRDQLPLG